MSKIVVTWLFALFALPFSFPAWADYGSLWSLISVDPDYQSPKKCGKNAFVVVSWNVSNFGGNEPPERIEMVSNVLRHAEMAFVLEVSASFQGPKAVATLHDALMRKGAKWQYSVSNPSTPEPAGKNTSERIAFLWKDSPSVKFGANSVRLVSELEKTVAREPLSVWTIGPKIGKAEFVVFHARPEGSGAHEEGAAVANYVRTLSAGHQSDVRTVVLGDFNLPKEKLDPFFVPLGFRSGISGATSLRKAGDGLSKKRDNAYFNGENVCEAGRIRTDKLFGTDSVRASDHLPIYVVFDKKWRPSAPSKDGVFIREKTSTIGGYFFIPSNMSFLSKLDWRYATKKFDPTKKVSESDIGKILEAIRMTPTSFGLEAYKVAVVSDQDTKNALREASFWQESVSSASHVIVLCARTDLFRVKEEKFTRLSSWDSEKRKGLSKFENVVRAVLLFKNLTLSAKTWSEKQTYIHLGFAMAACAELGIDSCPLEGFRPWKYAKILRLPSNLSPTLVLPVGYRSENDVVRPKSRSALTEILING